MPETSSDEFWLEVGRELVKQRVTSEVNAGEKLVTGVGWFWSAYTAAAFVGIALAGRDLGFWHYLAAGVPSVLLLVAYLVALRPLMPVWKSFDPRSIKETKKAEETIYKNKRNWRRGAYATLCLAALFVAVAFAVVFTAPETKSDAFAASFESGSITFAGRVGDGDDTPVTVKATPTTQIAAGAATPPGAMTLISSGSGEFQGVFDNVPSATYVVEASWTVEDQTRSVSVTVKPPEPTPSPVT